MQHIPAQLSPVDESEDRHAVDRGMEDMFDFNGYQDGHQYDQTPPFYQPHNDTRHKTYDDAGVSDQVDGDAVEADCDYDEDDDDDGWLQHVQAAFQNYYSSPLLETQLIPSQSSSLAEDLADPPGSVDVAELIKVSQTEKWNVDKATVDFLTSLMADDPVSSRYGLRPMFRDIKLEEPVLSTDPATDMQRLYERNTIYLTSEGIKPFPLDKRHDQSLHWSTKSLQLPNEMDKLLAAEKMAVDVETGNFLKDVLEDSQGDPVTLLTRDRRYKNIIRPITPPLLPLSPPYSPGRIPSPAVQLPLTSTPEDPSLREAAALEAQFMEVDDTVEMEVDGPERADMYSSIQDSAESSSSPLRRKFSKLSNLKISSPLLPLETDEPLTKKAKTVSFTEELQTMIPHRASDEVSTDPFVAADEALATISAMIEPLAQPVLKKAHSERLIEIDTTARVEVTPIDKVRLIAPWELYYGHQRRLMKDTRAEITRAEKKWSGATSLERLLPWSPFPAHLGKPKSEGDFDDGSFARYLAELDIEDRADLQSMVWKPEGLRLLDFDENDEDELEPSYCNLMDEEADEYQRSQVLPITNLPRVEPTTSLHFEPGRTAQSTTAKPTALATGSTPHSPSMTALGNSNVPALQNNGQRVSSMQMLLQNRRQQLQLEKAALRPAVDAGSSVAATRSASSEQTSSGIGAKAYVNQGTLSGFMAMQGIREKPRKEVETIKPPEGLNRSIPTAPMLQPPAVPMPLKAAIEVPAPAMLQHISQLPVVVSSTIMANRQLIRKLEQTLPAIEFVERDLSKIASTEADLSLSPSTGLMITTLQKVKQRPLPGQEASFVGVREQIARVAPPYERLIVLVSEGSHSLPDTPIHVRDLDQRDCDALADFIGFFTRFETEVQVSYVPGGNEELAKWIAAAVTRYAPCVERFNLLQDETVWELFLRKAGMNVFAAQVVLGELKGPEMQPESDSSTVPPSQRPSEFVVSGLAAFVLMDAEVRVRKFGPLLGGEKVLRRVSMAIDGSWNAGSKKMRVD